jgi:uncharacterized membrane protein
VPDEIQKLTQEFVPAWRRRTRGEPRWTVTLAIAVMIVLQWMLPDKLTLGPGWLLPAIELTIAVVLFAADPGRIRRDTGPLRMLGLSLIAVASLGTAWSAGMLVRSIATGRETGSAVDLLAAGGSIYLINVLTFAVWFWELDRGGPARRALGTDPYPDLLFPPMTAPDMAHPEWEPRFFDYLYVAFTNATAFSPTDTLPMSRWAKAAMALEAAISLVTAALVIARAVNVL